LGDPVNKRWFFLIRLMPGSDGYSLKAKVRPKKTLPLNDLPEGSVGRKYL